MTIDIKTQKNKNIRALAAKCCYNVVDKGRSLNTELPKLQSTLIGKDKGLLQEICFGVLRFLPELEHDVRQFIQKPMTGKQRVFHFLLLVGVYQIKHMRIPDHAAVSETVSATSALKNRHMKSLINGVLRNYVRALEKNQLKESSADAVKYNHPSWFIKKIQDAYPEEWESILFANLQRPPMWLRVNQQHHTLDSYKKLLVNADIDIDCIEPTSKAICLSHAVDVIKLPGFEQGWVSIQDAAAQQAADLLDCQPKDNVLDCCAAPGGKTCHILEKTPSISSMTAIDVEPDRLTRVHENLQRLNLTANVVSGDATTPENWWDNKLFDRILLDVPCSGTGVIRRHPDIKWLRKSRDIDSLVILQSNILKKCWSLLKPGGTLLYATCSVLPEENSQQIESFIKTTNDATLIPIKNSKNNSGWQLLPNEQNTDGFYYAKLLKNK